MKNIIAIATGLVLMALGACYADAAKPIFSIDLLNDFCQIEGLSKGVPVNIKSGPFYNFEKALEDGRTAIGTVTRLSVIYKIVNINIGEASYGHQNDFILAPSIALNEILGDDAEMSWTDFFEPEVGAFVSPDDYKNLTGHWSSGVFAIFLHKDF